MMETKYSILLIFFLSSQIISTMTISTEVRLENLKFLPKRVFDAKNSDKLSNANSPAPLWDSARTEKIFDLLDPTDFSVNEQDWNRAKELEHFKVVMSGGGDTAEMLAYCEIILKKFGITRLSELEEIYTMSESLQFLLDYYKNAVQLVDKVIKLYF